MTPTTEPPSTTRAALPRAAERPRPGLLTGLSHVALVVWALLVVLPLLWTLLASFKNNTEIFGDALQLPAELRWDNWTRAWGRANVGTYMLNTVVVVAAGTFGTMLFGSLAAYVLARYRFPGNRLIYYLFVSGMAFPVFLALVPLFFVVDQVGLLNTHTGLVLVYIAYSLPFTIFFLAAFFKTLPASVAEAAMIDGASHVRTFFQVMLPMARPGLISIAIFNVLGQWNQYLLPLVLLSGAKDKWVITQGIADISTIAGYEADWPGLFAALSMSIIPVLVVYVVFQRQIQSGLTSGALK
ncbi:carbohydrate ABC transporter permease [Streptosporangium roseum]|uniref:carbohydrate ABC transporter permease n=1 Tax=Streptosporangium roseum TaxID=2001 RepID=UPI00332BD5F0